MSTQMFHHDLSGNKSKGRKGFASMTKDQVTRIARMGGLTVSQDKDHMAKIGQRGGTISGLRRKRRANPPQSM